MVNNLKKDIMNNLSFYLFTLVHIEDSLEIRQYEFQKLNYDSIEKTHENHDEYIDLGFLSGENSKTKRTNKKKNITANEVYFLMINCCKTIIKEVTATKYFPNTTRLKKREIISTKCLE